MRGGAPPAKSTAGRGCDLLVRRGRAGGAGRGGEGRGAGRRAVWGAGTPRAGPLLSEGQLETRSKLL